MVKQQSNLFKTIKGKDEGEIKHERLEKNFTFS